MKVLVYDARQYDRHSLEEENKRLGLPIQLDFEAARLNVTTAKLAVGYDAVCVFVNDKLDNEVVEALANGGVKTIALRCAGFDNVDLDAANRLNITVLRVPAYSPNTVAEHAVALLMCLARKLHRSYARVREGNFALDGLVGVELHNKTVGILGTGKIGACFARIMKGFGCKLVAYDVYQDEQLAAEVGLTYLPFAEVLGCSDILSMHLPFLPSTEHIINEKSIAQMKKGVILINTSRGALLDTGACIEAIRTGTIGSLGIDVLEGEAGTFFNDRSEFGVENDQLARLLLFPNVVVTGHQAFLTATALQNIAATTLDNLVSVRDGKPSKNVVKKN